VVFFSPGLTMASFMEQALVAQLERAEKKRARAVDRRLKTVSKLSLKSAINLLAARAFWSAAWVRHGQSGLMLHRTRHLFIRQQTSVINAIRAHLVGWAEP
jgi:hypothetical protein